MVACFVNQEGNLHRFTKCEFLNNHGRNRGGVFRLKNKNVKFNVEDSLFRGNTATNGSCYFVGIDEGNGVNGLQQFIRCAFVSNVTVKTGGAVYAHYCKMPDFYDCLFTNNCASSGGALYMQGLYDQAWKAMVVSNCTFACNRSLSAAGGAVYGMQSGNYPYSFKDCRFVGNQSVANQHGGAVFIYNVGSAVFDGCSFTDNRAGLHGGAIGTTEYALIKLRDCDFSCNAATGNGGALFVNYGSSLKKDPYIATMTNCLFYGNQAQNGGAIYWARAAAGDYANLSVCACRFVGNTAEGGNGGSVYFLGSSGNLSNGSFENCLFSGNSSASYGGAAHINGITTASFSSCTMAWNAAASGGTFALGDGVAPLANCIFHSGSASNGGREICAFSQSSSTIKSVGIIMHHVAFDSDPGEFVYGGDESMLSYNQEGMDDFVEKNVGQGMYYGKEDLVGDVVAGGRGDDAETWVMRSRLNSKAGYWAGSAWSKGSRNSKLIDAGPAEWPVGLEPTGHNGNRINMGFDAGTAYASWTKDPAFMLTLR